MHSIIEKIIIFDDNGKSREVTFKPGLNIITGDSKTGKSALIEIVDYCLFSGRSTIPKGVIDNYAKLFVLVLKVSDKYIAIARPNFKTGNGDKAYLKIETNNLFLKGIEESYFTSSPIKNIKEVQEEVEKHLGLAVNDSRIDEDEDKRNSGKVSLRSMVSFLFQHQNLIANKHSLFYRFDDSFKRKKTIADYPILLGWESNEYFLLYRELEMKKKELKTELKLIDKLRIQDDVLLKKFYDIVDTYYSFLGMELDEDLRINELKYISKTLPLPPISAFSNLNIKRDIEKFILQRYELKNKLIDVEKLLDGLINNNEYSTDFIYRLKKLNYIQEMPDEIGEITCPVCKNHVPYANESVAALLESKLQLDEEISKIGTYKIDNSEQVELLQKERDILKKEINVFSLKISNLEKQDEEFNKNKTSRDQMLVLKGVTQTNVELLLNQNGIIGNFSDIENLKSRIVFLKEKIDGFDIESKISEAESFLSNRMTQICEKLDFEDELKPGRLKFSLKDFSFYYHFNGKDKIYIAEMGSGANWLACHLSLFLALLHLNCKSKLSAIPAFLMIDQPSQVYFPRVYKEDNNINGNTLDENIQQVKNIFKVINEEIDIISKDCGIVPQIIVMDHADEEDFAEFVIKRWVKDGEKLI